MKPATVTVAAIQTSLTDDVDKNVAHVEDLIRGAAKAGAQIILPSELFEGWYFCRGCGATTTPSRPIATTSATCPTTTRRCATRWS